MNFLQLQNLVAYWLDDLQFGYFTQTQVQVWLNNAQREVQKRLIKAGQNYYLKCVQTTMNVNQSDYVLPIDFLKIQRLEVVVSGVIPNESVYPLSPITTMQRDLIQTGSGQPVGYSFTRNRIILQPAPQISQVLRLFYSYLVADMTLSTDLPDVPAQYVELIALLAAQDGFLKDGRGSELLVKKIGEYEKDMDSNATERNQDFPRGIVETGFSMENGDFLW